MSSMVSLAYAVQAPVRKIYDQPQVTQRVSDLSVMIPEDLSLTTAQTESVRARVFNQYDQAVELQEKQIAVAGYRNPDIIQEIRRLGSQMKTVILWCEEYNKAQGKDTLITITDLYYKASEQTRNYIGNPGKEREDILQALEDGNIREILYLLGELHKNKSFKEMMQNPEILQQLNEERALHLQVDPKYGTAGIGVTNSSKMRDLRPKDEVIEINRRLVEEENPTYEEYNARALCPLSPREEAHLRSIREGAPRMPHGSPKRIFIPKDFDDVYWRNMDTLRLKKIAGVSNSVDQIMTAAMALGGDFHKVLTACMAVFVDGEAHSLYEVAAVGRSFGEEPDFTDITRILDERTKRILEIMQSRLPISYFSETNIREVAKEILSGS